MKMNLRKKSGSMLVFIICISVAVFVPILVLVCTLAPHLRYCGQAQNVVDAAALLAANDLSRIVINDSHFGFVSLSNRAAEGTATRALDGEPLPVIGLNTLIATLRQNAILAQELRNQKLSSLVERDGAFLDRTIWDLSTKLNESVGEKKSSASCFDMNGQEVDPLANVKEFLAKNLPPSMKVERLSLKLGWLDGGSDTTVAVPSPHKYSQLSVADVEDGKYEAFKNYPVGKRNFTFAGLGKQSHLVSSRKFKDADGQHICTVLKLECTLVSTEAHQAKTYCVSCSQPYAQTDDWNPGAMVLRYDGQPVSGLSTWSEFLSTGNFEDNKVTSFYVSGGDYPLEQKAKLYKSRFLSGAKTSEEFAEHLYYWLRNGRIRPHIDAVLTMMNEPFLGSKDQVYVYEFMEDGTIQRKAIEQGSFARPVSADGQYSTLADTRVRSGSSAIVHFRDNVTLLSSKSGKHGGQPLAGYPLGANESVSETELARRFSKRKDYQRGIALDIEIGTSGPSTARNDVVSMRERTRSRSI